MSELLVVGIISATAAILGSSVGLIAQLIEHKHQHKARIDDMKIKSHLDFIRAMQDFMNSSNPERFLKFQDAINVILIVAGHSVADEVNRYYKNLIDGENRKIPLTEKEHTLFQSEIINRMRKDVAFSHGSINNAQLVAYRN